MDALYLDPPAGFDYALRLGEYLKGTDLSKDPKVWVQIAAARGQEFSYKSSKFSAGNMDELGTIRHAALDAVRKVAELEPDANGPSRRMLKSIYVPGSGIDDDLTVFYGMDGSADFDAAIGVTR